MHVEMTIDDAVNVVNVANDWPRYVRNGAAVMQAHLWRYPEYKDAVLTERELAVADDDAVQATAAQWALAQGARAILTGA